jgi:predicted RNA-binding protein YlxR (DUF448 family)
LYKKASRSAKLYYSEKNFLAKYQSRDLEEWEKDLIRIVEQQQRGEVVCVVLFGHNRGAYIQEYLRAVKGAYVMNTHGQHTGPQNPKKVEGDLVVINIPARNRHVPRNLVQHLRAGANPRVVIFFDYIPKKQHMLKEYKAYGVMNERLEPAFIVKESPVSIDGINISINLSECQ